MKNNYFTLSLLVLSIKINAEVFSSIAKLEPLLETQKDLIETLDNLLKEKKSKNKIVKSYLDLLKKEHQDAMNNTSRYLGNPINGFRLIKRLTADFDFVKNVLNKITDFKRNKKMIYPRQKDLLGAAEGILRLQTTYDLRNTLLANGGWNISYGATGKTYVESFTPMSASDCFELGKALYEIKMYPPGVEWMKEAVRKIDERDRNIPEGIRITTEDLQQQISYGIRRGEQFFNDILRWFRELIIRSPDIDKHIGKIDRDKIITCYKNGLTPEKTVKVIEFEEHLAASYNPQGTINLSLNELNKTYTALCRGERTSTKLTKRLSCYFAHGPHPFLILAPVKAERLHIAPNFILFHDVISDAEIQAIKALATPKLARAQVSNGYITEDSTERVCQTAFAHSNESIAVAQVRRRVSQFTGMDLTSKATEPLQIMNYGIGGFHKMHYDYSTNVSFIRNEGNRLATVNFFMSDVEQGGATVFPALGLSVFPVKGAALLWKNLLHTGKGNPYTFHAACPVLLGSKWVATQWINSLGQELRHPCLLDSKQAVYSRKI